MNANDDYLRAYHEICGGDWRNP